MKIGETLGHYKIIEKIGRGGMGEVYLAEDTKLDRQVALKILPAEFAEDTERMNRFVREAKSASALNHPNIITIYEINEFENTHYIATEFIDGKTLDEYTKDNPLNFQSALDIAIQVASALDEAHRAGIIHRDIKPDNVMIRENGLAKILDFGIAKLTEKQEVEIDSEDATAIHISTTPGMIIGTANYMSPEQAKGKEVDKRTDIFSFGVLLYEMVSGRLPFEGDTPMEMIAAIINKEPKPLDSSEIPAEIKRIIDKALRKDRDERYQTIKGLLADLKEVKRELEFQDKLEKTIQPNEDENSQTQMFKAEATANEQKQTTTANDSISIKRSSFSKLAIGAIAVLLLSVISLGYWFFAAKSERIKSIAVMPFVNESGDKEVEYLSDGMTETLINSLSSITDLQVKARSSVFRYKGKDLNPQTVASELSVQALLTGRIVQRGDQLILNLELIDPGTENALWGKRYERKSSELVTLQTEITKDVLSQLKSRLSGEENAKIGVSNTDDSEAYKLYLKGRFYAEKRTGKDLLKSLEFYDQAIAEDPNYALAYTGLAESYGVLSLYGVSTPKETMPKAREAAKKALALNDNLAEAHSALGNVLARYDFDFTGAEREFKRAIELNPKHGIAHNWYAELLSNLGRHDEAIRSIQRALEIDPLFLTYNRVYAFMLSNADRFDESEVQYKKTIELDENYAVTYADLSYLYQVRKDYAKTVEAYTKAVELSGDREGAAELRSAYNEGGWAGYLRKQIERVDSNTAGKFYQDATIKVYSFIGLGENDKALDELDKMYEMRSAEIFQIKVDALLDPLREEPRFKKLIKKVGFPE